MMSIPKLNVLQRIVETGMIAIIRGDVSNHSERIADACIEGGVSIIEVTFTVPHADRVIETLAEKYAARGVIVGAGTVLDAETARIALLAGARFIVSPSLNKETARLCNRYQAPYLPGAGTVKEIIESMEVGADIVKIFPSDNLGPGFVRAVRSPLPQAQLMPTGGVSLNNVEEWIRAGCIAVGVSGGLTGSGAAPYDSPEISALAAEFLGRIRKARSA